MKNPKNLIFLALIGVLFFSCQGPLIKTGETTSLSIGITIPGGLKSQVPEAVQRAISSSDLASRFVHPGTREIIATISLNETVLTSATSYLDDEAGERTATLTLGGIPLNTALNLKIVLKSEIGDELGNYEGVIGPISKRNPAPLAVYLKPDTENVFNEEENSYSLNPGLNIVKMTLPETGIYDIFIQTGNSDFPMELYLADGQRHRGFCGDPDELPYGFFGADEAGDYYLVIYAGATEGDVVKFEKYLSDHIITGKLDIYSEDFFVLGKIEIEGGHTYLSESLLGNGIQLEGFIRAMPYNIYNPWNKAINITDDDIEIDEILELEDEPTDAFRLGGDSNLGNIQPGKYGSFTVNMSYFGGDEAVSPIAVVKLGGEELFEVSGHIAYVSDGSSFVLGLNWPIENTGFLHGSKEVYRIAGSHYIDGGDEYFGTLEQGFYYLAADDEEALPLGYVDDFKIELFHQSGATHPDFHYDPDIPYSGYFGVSEDSGDYYMVIEYVGADTKELDIHLSKHQGSLLVFYDDSYDGNIGVHNKTIVDFGYWNKGNSNTITFKLYNPYSFSLTGGEYSLEAVDEEGNPTDWEGFGIPVPVTPFETPVLPSEIFEFEIIFAPTENSQGANRKATLTIKYNDLEEFKIICKGSTSI